MGSPYFFGLCFPSATMAEIERIREICKELLGTGGSLPALENNWVMNHRYGYPHVWFRDEVARTIIEVALP